jgi:hypothetical protein
MPLPKKIKKYLPLTQPETLLSRRYELLDKINKDGTFLPKSILHADLDGGFLEFVKETLNISIDGVSIPTVNVIMTTQNWAQFTETWDFQNIDKNVEPPFITVIRTPEVKFGTNPATLYNIPNRRLYFYAQVPTWDGNRKGMDIYKIPQPVPVDITYQVKIICNRMRELNEFNKKVIETFASRQAYQVIKGHYIPIIMNSISDESVMDLEKRRFYIQNYEFTLLGFLIDENQFEVMPAINRVFTMVEFGKDEKKRNKKSDSNPKSLSKELVFQTGTTIVETTFNYSCNILIGNTENVQSYDVYINDDLYGITLSEIYINSGDVLKLDIVKIDNNILSTISLNILLI